MSRTYAHRPFKFVDCDCRGSCCLHDRHFGKSWKRKSRELDTRWTEGFPKYKRLVFRAVRKRDARNQINEEVNSE